MPALIIPFDQGQVDGVSTVGVDAVAAKAEAEKVERASIGIMILLGILADQDVARGLKLLEIAALQGSLRGSIIIKPAFNNGFDIPQDIRDAIEVRYGVEIPEDIYVAAGEGYMNFQYAVGYMKTLGIGVDQDVAEGMNWFQQAAKQGHPQGLNVMGLMSSPELGRPVDLSSTIMRHTENSPRNLPLAINWFRSAAARGCADAQYNHDHLMPKLMVNIPSASIAVDPIAIETSEQARQYTNVPHIPAKELKRLDRLVKDLAEKYPDHMAAGKYAEIAELTRISADAGGASALYDLARMYYHGVGVEHSISEAEELCCHKALHGHDGAVDYIRTFCGIF